MKKSQDKITSEKKSKDSFKRRESDQIQELLVGFTDEILKKIEKMEKSQYGEKTTITPINDETSLKKSVIQITIPEDNISTYCAIRGQASEHIKGYPLIIRVYNNENPVHTAHVDLNDDGSFEYQFKVKKVDNNTGKITKIFQGDFIVDILKVIPNSILKTS